MQERKTVTKALARQYRRARKGRKARMLTEFVEATGYNRCYAGWLLRQHGRRVEVGPGVAVEGDVRKRALGRARPRVYGPEVARALTKVWQILDYLSGKRLAPALAEVVPRLIACKELRVSRRVRDKLMAISPATIDRLLQPERAKPTLKRRGGTKPGTLLKHQVPVRTFADWDEAQVGFLEMDLVGHDGGSTHGEYCQTLDVTDVATGWSAQCAVLTRAQCWVFEAIQAIRRRLPFAMRGLDSDNGGEFINGPLQAYCETNGLTFTRSRPWRKNDTCYIEQKNWSVVRRYVGYARYEGDAAVQVLNRLYAVVHDYVNFFLPSMKLKEKTRDGARVRRRYDRAKTPYQRLLDAPDVPAAVKRRLRAHYATLNPAALHRDLQRLTQQLNRLATRPVVSAQAPPPPKPAPNHPWRRPWAKRNAA